MIKQINPLTTILAFILRASVCQTLPVATPAWPPPLPTEMAWSHTGRSFYWLIIDHREFYINKLIYQKPPWPTFAFCTISQHTQQRCGDPSAVPHMVEVEGSNWLHAKKKGWWVSSKMLYSTEFSVHYRHYDWPSCRPEQWDYYLRNPREKQFFHNLWGEMASEISCISWKEAN